MKSRQRGGVRQLLDVDLFEISPVLFGAHDDARLIDVKRHPAGLKTKSTAGVARALARRTTRTRPGLPTAVPCSVCRQPAAPLVNGGLRDREQLICATCVQVMHDALDEHTAHDHPAHRRPEGPRWQSWLSHHARSQRAPQRRRRLLHCSHVMNNFR